MKKLLTKFTSIFLAVIVLMSCLTAVTVSAESTAEVLNEPLLKSLPEPPLKYLSNFFDNDILIYDKFVIYRYYYNNRTYYTTYCINSVSKNSSVISYFNLGSNSSSCYDNDLKQLSFNCVVLNYCQDTDTYTSSRYINTSYANALALATNNYTVNGTDLAIETATKNIIYSDFVFKYGGLTVFDPAKDNKSFTIPCLFDSSGSSTNPEPIAPTPGDYDFVGPLPLIPVEGDANFQGFKEWLIKNKKYEDLAKYGITCTAENVSAVVDLWTGNYNSINGFFTGLKSMWSTINVVSQAKNIYNWFEQQWQLYKKSLITYETIHVKDKDVLDYDKDYDEDGNFISSETAYLKLILGVLMTFRDDVNNFSNSLISYISSISVNINRLCNAVSTLPQVTANSIYNNLVNPFNLILDAINNNSSGSSTTENITNNTNNYYTYNTEISDSEYDEFDGLFNEYNQKYDEIIKSKFPFINQVTGIFDEVWKACGYDETSVLSDDIATYSQSYALLSTVPQQTQEDKVNSAMSSIFPAYNKSYLGSISSDAPQFNINVAGTEVSIIDFRLFDKYRSIIHAIITCCLWLPYLWSLFKSIPGIIANVGDVRDVSIRYDLNEYKVAMKEDKFVDIPISNDRTSGMNIDVLDGVASAEHNIIIPELDDGWSKI